MGSPAALPPLPPCSDERREIAGGSATDKDAARSGRKLSEVCEPRQRLVLGVDRAGTFEPRTGIHVAGSNDKVEQHRRLSRRPRHERQKQRMIDADARRGELIGENAQRFGRTKTFGGDRLADLALQLTERLRSIKWRWIHSHAIDGVADDRISELLAVLVVIVHPIAVGFIWVGRRCDRRCV